MVSASTRRQRTGARAGAKSNEYPAVCIATDQDGRQRWEAFNKEDQNPNHNYWTGSKGHYPLGTIAVVAFQSGDALATVKRLAATAVKETKPTREATDKPFTCKVSHDVLPLGLAEARRSEARYRDEGLPHVPPATIVDPSTTKGFVEPDIDITIRDLRTTVPLSGGAPPATPEEEYRRLYATPLTAAEEWDARAVITGDANNPQRLQAPRPMIAVRIRLHAEPHEDRPVRRWKLTAVAQEGRLVEDSVVTILALGDLNHAVILPDPKPEGTRAFACPDLVGQIGWAWKNALDRPGMMAATDYHPFTSRRREGLLLPPLSELLGSGEAIAQAVKPEKPISVLPGRYGQSYPTGAFVALAYRSPKSRNTFFVLTTRPLTRFLKPTFDPIIRISELVPPAGYADEQGAPIYSAPFHTHNLRQRCREIEDRVKEKAELRKPGPLQESDELLRVVIADLRQQWSVRPSDRENLLAWAIPRLQGLREEHARAKRLRADAHEQLITAQGDQVQVTWTDYQERPHSRPYSKEELQRMLDDAKDTIRLYARLQEDLSYYIDVTLTKSPSQLLEIVAAERVIAHDHMIRSVERSVAGYRATLEATPYALQVENGRVVCQFDLPGDPGGVANGERFSPGDILRLDIASKEAPDKDSSLELCIQRVVEHERRPGATEGVSLRALVDDRSVGTAVSKAPPSGQAQLQCDTYDLNVAERSARLCYQRLMSDLRSRPDEDAQYLPRYSQQALPTLLQLYEPRSKPPRTTAPRLFPTPTAMEDIAMDIVRRCPATEPAFTDPDQRAALLLQASGVQDVIVVDSPAGCGKTTYITAGCLYELALNLQDPTRPQQIVLAADTNHATEELSNRVNEALLIADDPLFSGLHEPAAIRIASSRERTAAEREGRSDPNELQAVARNLVERARRDPDYRRRMERWLPGTELDFAHPDAHLLRAHRDSAETSVEALSDDQRRTLACEAAYQLFITKVGRAISQVAPVICITIDMAIMLAHRRNWSAVFVDEASRLRIGQILAILPAVHPVRPGQPRAHGRIVLVGDSTQSSRMQINDHRRKAALATNQIHRLADLVRQHAKLEGQESVLSVLPASVRMRTIYRVPAGLGRVVYPLYYRHAEKLFNFVNHHDEDLVRTLHHLRFPTQHGAAFIEIPDQGVPSTAKGEGVAAFEIECARRIQAALAPHLPDGSTSESWKVAYGTWYNQTARALSTALGETVLTIDKMQGLTTRIAVICAATMNYGPQAIAHSVQRLHVAMSRHDRVLIVLYSARLTASSHWRELLDRVAEYRTTIEEFIVGEPAYLHA